MLLSLSDYDYCNGVTGFFGVISGTRIGDTLTTVEHREFARQEQTYARPWQISWRGDWNTAM